MTDQIEKAKAAAKAAYAAHKEAAKANGPNSQEAYDTYGAYAKAQDAACKAEAAAVYETARIAANHASGKFCNAQYRVKKAERELTIVQERFAQGRENASAVEAAREELAQACEAFNTAKAACKVAEDAEFNAAMNAFPEQL